MGSLFPLPVLQGIVILIVCAAVCLVLGARPKGQPYPVKTGMPCFQQRRELTVCRGLGLGLLAGVLVWFPVHRVFGFLKLDELISLIFTVFLVPWVFLVWKSLDHNQNVDEVQLKLRKLVRVAAGTGVALALFTLSLIPTAKDSARNLEERKNAAQAVRNR